MNKSLSYGNLSLEIHVASTFWLGSDTSSTFSLHFTQHHHMSLREQPWKMLILWCRTDICCCKFCSKVSLMLDNPFLVPSLCKLNYISLCFIQISTKSLENCSSLQGKQTFFWSHPRCFELLGKFQHNIKISIKAACVPRLSVFCDCE